MKGMELASRDFKNELAKLINDSGLPPTLVNYILKDVIFEVSGIADNMLKKEDRLYQEELEKEKKKALAQNRKNRKKGEKKQWQNIQKS